MGKRNQMDELMAELRYLHILLYLMQEVKDFETANRKKFCVRIATGDYDAVIIVHSQFEKIPVSQERQERLLNAQIDEITASIAELKGRRGCGPL